MIVGRQGRHTTRRSHAHGYTAAPATRTAHDDAEPVRNDAKAVRTTPRRCATASGLPSTAGNAPARVARVRSAKLILIFRPGRPGNDSRPAVGSGGGTSRPRARRRPGRCPAPTAATAVPMVANTTLSTRMPGGAVCRCSWVLPETCSACRSRRSCTCCCSHVGGDVQIKIKSVISNGRWVPLTRPPKSPGFRPPWKASGSGAPWQRVPSCQHGHRNADSIQ
jgi:hypothetical protein